MVAIPGLPASRLFQPSATVLPTGLMRPSPVTTTRRRPIYRPALAAHRRPTAGDIRPALKHAGSGTGALTKQFIIKPSSGLLMGDGVVDRQLHRGDFLGLFIGNLDAEFVFE